MRATSRIAALCLMVMMATAAATAAAVRVLDSVCAHPIQPIGSSKSYDLSWWMRNGPFTGKDVTGTYTYNFGICNTLPTACPYTSDPTAKSACPTPNSAYACQSWNSPSNPGQQYSACAASTSVAPYFAECSDQNGERGIVVMYGGGDDCSVCSPMPRAMQYVIFCDAAYQSEPQILQVVSPNAPSPIASIIVRHCSGCAIGTPGACPTQPSGQVSYSLDWSFTSNSTAMNSIGLLPPPLDVPVTVKSVTGNDLHVSGSMTPGRNATLSVMVRTPAAIGFGTLTFADSNTVSMGFRDAFNKKGYMCYPAKQALGAVSFVCPYDSNGALAVAGFVN